MRLSSIGRTTVFFFFTALIFSYTTVRAQSVNDRSNSAAQAGVTAQKPDPDFSLSIDPMSVNSFSDDRLNDTFDKMTAQFSKNAVLFNNIGATFFKRKMYDKAETAIRHAVALNNHPAFLTNLSIIYDTENRLPEAISAAQRAVNQSPRYVRARNQLCELMLVSKRNADTLICYDELAKIDPLDELAQTYYAVALMRSGEAEKVISMLTPLVRGTNPTAVMYNTLGFAYYIKKRYAQAASTFKQGVELAPDDAALRYNLAVVLTAQNDRAGALSQYNLIKSKNTSLADQLYRGLNRDKIIYVNQATASNK